MQIAEEEDKLYAHTLAVSYVQDGLPLVPHLSFSDQDADIVRVQNEVSGWRRFAGYHLFAVVYSSMTKPEVGTLVTSDNNFFDKYLVCLVSNFKLFLTILIILIVPQ